MRTEYNHTTHSLALWLNTKTIINTKRTFKIAICCSHTLTIMLNLTAKQSKFVHFRKFCLLMQMIHRGGAVYACVHRWLTKCKNSITLHVRFVLIRGDINYTSLCDPDET